MSEKKSGIQGIIQELRNRRVFRVAAVYLGVAFAILEAADILIPMFGLPQIIVVITLCVLMIGFPIATTLAWHLQVTEEGIRRSPKSGEKQDARQKPLTSNAIIILLLLVIAILLMFPRSNSVTTSELVTNSEPVEILDAKAVAVLPFTNFSASEEDAYFADGIHDDILTQLSKIRDLRIISRTTMIKYKATDLSISEIAREVGAANVLEGSVRRAGDQIRIVAQLIEAQTDDHLWADTYDRQYADIFSIQTDVARKIASALRSTLTPEEERELENIPTRNMDAYDYFLRGNTYWYTKTTKEGNLRAAAMYQKAVDLDPMFGLAYARLSIVHSVLYQAQEWDPTPERKAMAKSTLEKAKVLIPNHAETHFAQGVFHDWCENNSAAALKEFQNASDLDPTKGEFAQHAGALLFSLGEWEKAEKYLKIAVETEPDAIGNNGWWAGFNELMRNHTIAETYYLREIQVNPENAQVYRWLSSVYIYGFNDSERAKKILDDGLLVAEESAFLKGVKFWYLLDERNYNEALDLAEEYHTNSSFYYEGIVKYLLEDEIGMTQALDSALQIGVRRAKENPSNAFTYSRLALIHALLGNKQAAISSAREAMEIQPVSTNAIFGPAHVYRLAEIYSILNEADKALTTLNELLSSPNDVTTIRITLNPFFDSLRDHPDYLKMISKYRQSA